MLFFGHIGITAGVVKACDVLTSVTKPGTVGGGEQLHPHYLPDRIKERIGLVDYRMLLLGSLLPDIIDKSLWFLVAGLTGQTFLSGRGYAHTLVFNLALLVGGLVLIRYGKSWLLIISLSSLGHLILDQIWEIPVVLLWPLLGPLSGAETTGWFYNIFQGLFSCPEVYIPEIIGLLVVLFLAWRVVTRKSVFRFIRNGAIT